MKPEKQKKHAALRALLIALLTLALLAAGFAAYRFWRLPRAGFAVHFVDIGQGDAAIVVCDGKTLVIDEAAATRLTHTDYYRYAWANKPTWQGL